MKGSIWLKTNIPALKVIRMTSGMSQRELAHRANLAHTTILRIEKGERNASPKTGKKIAEALGVPMQAIFFIQQCAE